MRRENRPGNSAFFGFFFFNFAGEMFFGNYFVITGGNDSNLLIVFYVQIMPDDFVMQLHRF